MAEELPDLKKSENFESILSLSNKFISIGSDLYRLEKCTVEVLSSTSILNSKLDSFLFSPSDLFSNDFGEETFRNAIFLIKTALKKEDFKNAFHFSHFLLKKLKKENLNQNLNQNEFYLIINSLLSESINSFNYDIIKCTTKSSGLYLDAIIELDQRSFSKLWIFTPIKILICKRKEVFKSIEKLHSCLNDDKNGLFCKKLKEIIMSDLIPFLKKFKKCFNSTMFEENLKYFLHSFIRDIWEFIVNKLIHLFSSFIKNHESEKVFVEELRCFLLLSKEFKKLSDLKLERTYSTSLIREIFKEKLNYFAFQRINELQSNVSFVGDTKNDNKLNEKKEEFIFFLMDSFKNQIQDLFVEVRKKIKEKFVNRIMAEISSERFCDFIIQILNFIKNGYTLERYFTIVNVEKRMVSLLQVWNSEKGDKTIIKKFRDINLELKQKFLIGKKSVIKRFVHRVSKEFEKVVWDGVTLNEEQKKSLKNEGEFEVFAIDKVVSFRSKIQKSIEKIEEEYEAASGESKQIYPIHKRLPFLIKVDIHSFNLNPEIDEKESLHFIIFSVWKNVLRKICEILSSKKSLTFNEGRILQIITAAIYEFLPLYINENESKFIKQMILKILNSIKNRKSNFVSEILKKSEAIND